MTARFASQLLFRLVILLGMLLLGGCSMVRLTYDNAQTISYWWLDNYFDFSDEQADQVRADLRLLHQWHRSTQLAEYADLLATVRGRALDEVSPAAAREDVDRARAAIDLLAYRTVPYYARLARQLKPSQIAHLQRRFVEEDKKWREKWIAPSATEVAETRLDGWMDWAEAFYGDMSEEQNAYMKAAIARSAFDAQLAWENRQRQQQDIVATFERIMRSKPEQAGAEAEIRSLVERLLYSKDTAYASMLQKLIDETCINLAGLHQLTSRSQRERARDKLDGYERELRLLSKG